MNISLSSVPVEPPRGLTVAIREPDSDTAIVVARGDMDVTTAPAVSRCAERALHGHPPVLLLDMRAVGFCGCTGLRELLWIQGMAEPMGTHMRVAPSRQVRRAITLAGLLTELDVLDASAAGRLDHSMETK